MASHSNDYGYGHDGDDDNMFEDYDIPDFNEEAYAREYEQQHPSKPSTPIPKDNFVAPRFPSTQADPLQTNDVHYYKPNNTKGPTVPPKNGVPSTHPKAPLSNHQNYDPVEYSQSFRASPGTEYGTRDPTVPLPTGTNRSQQNYAGPTEPQRSRRASPGTERAKRDRDPIIPNSAHRTDQEYNLIADPTSPNAGRRNHGPVEASVPGKVSPKTEQRDYASYNRGVAFSTTAHRTSQNHGPVDKTLPSAKQFSSRDRDVRTPYQISEDSDSDSSGFVKTPPKFEYADFADRDHQYGRDPLPKKSHRGTPPVSREPQTVPLHQAEWARERTPKLSKHDAHMSGHYNGELQRILAHCHESGSSARPTC